MFVLVTGSSRGVGAAIARRFAREGYGVILHGRDAKAIGLVQREVEELGAPVDVVLGDVREEKTLEALRRAAFRHDISVLVNNAGSYWAGYAADAPDVVVERLIATNLLAPMRLTLLIYPLFVRRGSGLVININSLAGKGFNDREAVYSASKWGLRGFMGSFRHEARAHGVGVMDVYLGASRTAIARGRESGTTLVDPDEAAAVIYKASSMYQTAALNEIEIGRRSP